MTDDAERLRPRFWALSYVGKGFMYVEEPELGIRDVVEELIGTRVGQDWRPPKYKVCGSGDWPDWMCFPVPLVSWRALDQLEEFVAPSCEVLQWFAVDGHSYHLLNVISRVPRGMWTCEALTRYGEVISSAEGISILQEQLPGIFELEGLPHRVFVSDELARRSFSTGLSGALFVSPAIRSMNLAFVPDPSDKYGTGFII